MTSVARFLLVLTSLAPILVVRAFVALGGKHYEAAFVMLCVVALLVLFCIGLVNGIRERAAATPRKITEPAAKDAEPIAFFVAYALPLVSVGQANNDLWGLGAFAVIMAIASYQLEVYYVNPLLALFGYKFHAAKADDGAQVLVMSRERTLAAGELTVVEISAYLWLKGQKGGGADGRRSIGGTAGSDSSASEAGANRAR